MIESRAIARVSDLPCAGQTTGSVASWTARLKVGDAVVVREKQSENCYRYLLSHVIELLDADKIVLSQHGTFRRNGESVFLRRAFFMLEPSQALVEAAQLGALYVKGLRGGV